MKRRIWIKEIIIAGGGLLVLPACMNDEGASSIALKNFSFSKKDEVLLAAITEVIIPATITPGSKALNLHHFVFKMFDDCYDETEQKKLSAGLKAFDVQAKKQMGNSFGKLSPQEQLNHLRIIRNKGDNSDLHFFLSQTRRQTIRGYETSEYVLTKLLPYQLVPGHFYGCHPINKKA